MCGLIQPSSISCRLLDSSLMLSQLETLPWNLRPNMCCSLHSQSCFLLWPGPLCFGQYWSNLKSWMSVPALSFRMTTTCLVSTVRHPHYLGDLRPLKPPLLQCKWKSVHFLNQNLNRYVPWLQNCQDQEFWFWISEGQLPTWSGNSQTYFSSYFWYTSLHNISKVYAIPKLLLVPSLPLLWVSAELICPLEPSLNTLRQGSLRTLGTTWGLMVWTITLELNLCHLNYLHINVYFVSPARAEIGIIWQ